MSNPHDIDPTTEAQVNASCRGFMQSTLVVGASQIPGATAAAAAESGSSADPPLSRHVRPRSTSMAVERLLSREPRVTLLDALGESLAMTGSKRGCDRGHCGACAVLVDGRRINACLTLAVMHQGARITTIESMARGNQRAPIQAALIERDAFQCG